MLRKQWLSACTFFFILLSATFHVQAAVPEESLDLATLSNDVDITKYMQVYAGSEILRKDQQETTPTSLLSAPGWQKNETAEMLMSAPREPSTIWLKGVVRNTSAEPLIRWLDISPWRLSEVDAWFIDPQTQQILAVERTGLDVASAERSITSNRALLPVALSPGESQQLLLKVTSDSRPFLTINSWDPIDYTIEEATRHQPHTVLFTAVLMLLLVLLLQRNRKYALIGAWMLTTFIFESEKEGYFSYFLFDGLGGYTSNIRFITWILYEGLFLVASVYLLGLNKHRIWRWIELLVFGVVGVLSALSFVLSDLEMRNLGSAVNLSFSLLWVFIIPSALKNKCYWQWVFLALLSVWWMASTFILLGYVFNFYYTSNFSNSKIIVEIVVSLSLLLVYSFQKKSYEKQLEQELRSMEIEQREKLEQAIEVRTRELRQAIYEAKSANDAKSELLTRITHDLRSPLISILGYAQLMLPERGQVGEMSRTLYSSALHMLNLVDRLISYAYGADEGAMRLAPLYLHAFLESVAREAAISVQKNNNVLTLEAGDDLPNIVCCDESYLRQILLNLLDNAAKHTVDGKINLSVNHGDIDQEGGANLVFSVTDTGVGIPVELQDRLWDAFYQGPGQSEGLGLGLSIVQRLTQEMGGQVELNSAPNQGVRVSVKLPFEVLSDDVMDGAVLNLPRHILPYFNAEGLNAWVIEGGVSMRDFLASELKNLGFGVRTFPDSEAAIDAVVGSSAPPDIVLIDDLLSKVGGDAVLEAIKCRWLSVPVILLTATQRMPFSESVNGSECTACLRKPVDLIALRHSLAEACGRELNTPEFMPVLIESEDKGMILKDIMLDDDERKQIELFISLGAVTDLIEWCQTLVDKDSTKAELSLKLRSLAQQGRFDEISQMLS